MADNPQAFPVAPILPDIREGSDGMTLMDAAVVQIGELFDALEWLESHLKETPHHNAPAAANARQVLRKIRGGA